MQVLGCELYRSKVESGETEQAGKRQGSSLTTRSAGSATVTQPHITETGRVILVPSATPHPRLKTEPGHGPLVQLSMASQ